MDKRKQVESIQEAFSLLGDVMIRITDAESMTAAIQKVRSVGHAIKVEVEAEQVELMKQKVNGQDLEKANSETKLGC